VDEVFDVGGVAFVVSRNVGDEQLAVSCLDISVVSQEISFGRRLFWSRMTHSITWDSISSRFVPASIDLYTVLLY
jgi:hypothetical protein